MRYLENIIFIIFAILFMLISFGLFLIYDKVYTVSLSSALLSVGFLLRGVLYKKIHFGKISSAYLFYTNIDGDYIEQGRCLSENEIKQLEKILPCKARFSLSNDFVISCTGIEIESNKKKTRIYFNEKDFNLVKVSRFMFETEITNENAVILKKILEN